MTSIISYNVNGIRAAQRKGFLDWLQQESPDILCVQETKAQPDQLDDALLNPEGYHSYWFSAEKKGYSGVAVYSKEEPQRVEYGFGYEAYDQEGRVMRLDYQDYSVMALYLPSGSAGDHRQAAKDEFLRDFKPYIQGLKANIPHLILTGDFNICHTERDIHDPVGNKKSSGFLPHERAWFSEFLELGFVDAFRQYEQGEGHYTWWSYRSRARERNKGWRIDYHLVAEPLRARMCGYEILSEIYHSDHCPIKLLIE